MARLLPLLLAVACAPQAPDETRPNVVFILADDLGWKDVGYNGAESYSTPHIDRLAASGMTFTQAYASAPSCSPTRAAILTGEHPARLGLTRAIRLSEVDRSSEGGEKQRARSPYLQAKTINHLPPDVTTFADGLRDAGYRTCFIGKWHLGVGASTPEAFGFDEVRALGRFPASSYFPPYHVELEGQVEGEYLTDRLTREAVEFIRENRDRPFLVYLSHFAVHAPWEAKEELVELYRSRIDPASAQNNPVYAAMVHSLDESVGRILDELDELALADRTIVVFTSDNGGTVDKKRQGNTLFQVTSNAPLRGGKLSPYEGGLRVPAVMRVPGVTAAGSASDVPVVSTDYHRTLLSLTGVAPDPARPLGPDGVDLTPLLTGRGELGRDTIYFHMPHRDLSSAMRQGKWKLIHFFGGSTELYDLERDLEEAHDLSADMPERVENLRAELMTWLKDVEANMPVANPNYRPREEE